jgi:hypothetical protein
MASPLQALVRRGVSKEALLSILFHESRAYQFPNQALVSGYQPGKLLHSRKDCSEEFYCPDNSIILSIELNA